MSPLVGSWCQAHRPNNPTHSPAGARPMQLLALVTRPFVLLLTLSTHGLLYSWRKAEQPVEGHRRRSRSGGSEAGIIEQNEHDMVRNVFVWMNAAWLLDDPAFRRGLYRYPASPG